MESSLFRANRDSFQTYGLKGRRLLPGSCNHLLEAWPINGSSALGFINILLDYGVSIT